ncbi:MAG TPA: thiol:disulfide interchange protein DsbG, partial [Gammaproteobacteria bacterium]|nr:thiol:disulfide interchange protein DsbG [Gammaproteobacteria bacterium]
MGRRILLLVSLLFAGVPLASLAAAPAPAAGSAPSVLAYLKQQGLKINSRFTAMGGLTGYAGTTPDGSPVIFYVPADGSVAIFG